MTPRPRKTDDDIMATVAKRLIAKVRQWAGFPDEDEEDMLKDLTETLQDSVDLDGFKLAKKLEDDHYYLDADSGLADIMGQVDRIAYMLSREKTEAWVVANNITPAFRVGDHVTFEHGWAEQRSGGIVAIRRAEGRYTIQEDGRHYPDKDAGGWIVDYERVIGVATNGANA
jgi:hypothetical protein